MSENSARDEDPNVMGGPEPDEQETDVMEGADPDQHTDVMEGADPDQHTDVMDRPDRVRNHPAR
jgi:hypothetical protein